MIPPCPSSIFRPLLHTPPSHCQTSSNSSLLSFRFNFSSRRRTAAASSSLVLLHAQLLQLPRVNPLSKMLSPLKTITKTRSTTTLIRKTDSLPVTHSRSILPPSSSSDPSRIRIKTEAEITRQMEEISDSGLSSVPSDIEDFGFGINRELKKEEQEDHHGNSRQENNLQSGLFSRFFGDVVVKGEREVDDGLGNGPLEQNGGGESNRDLVKGEIKGEEEEVEGRTTVLEKNLRLFAFNPAGVSAPTDRSTNPPISAPSASKRKRKEPVRNPTARVKQGVKIEQDQDQDSVPLIKAEAFSEYSSAGEGPSTRPQKRTRKKTTTINLPSSSPPSSWLEMYNLVKTMRSSSGIASNAPVDTMGCERLALPPNYSTGITPEISRFQSLVALMLSSQTKDTVTAVAMKNLQTKLPHPGLCIDSILSVPDTELNSLINMVGFHNRKTTYLKQTALVLKQQYNSDIPDTVAGLTALPGVGPKMAYLCLSVAWNDTQGIGVDVHVHRITNLWGWNGKKGTRNPEETREMLEGWLPRGYWREINWLLVGFGQMVCLPRGPRCGECLLAERGLCRAAQVPRVRRGVKREVKEEEKVKVEYEDDGERGEVKVEVKKEEVGEANVIKEESVGFEGLDISVKEESEGEDGIGAQGLDMPGGEERIPDIEDGIPYHLRHEIEPEKEPTPEAEAPSPVKKRRAVRPTVVAESTGRVTRSAGKRAKR